MLTLPYHFAPNDDIVAETLETCFQTIADHFSGGIMDDDCSDLMGLKGSKIAVRSVPGDRIAGGTIDLTAMGLNCVGTDQLVALAVTKGKLTTTVGSRITKTQLEVSIWSGTVNVPGDSGTTPREMTAEASTATVGGVSSWAVTARCRDAYSPYNVQAVPTTAIPTASTTVLGIVMKGFVHAGTSNTLSFDLIYINNS